MAKQADPTEETPAKGGKKKLRVLGLVAVLALAGGAWFLLSSGGNAEAEAPHPGAVVELEPIPVNLAGGSYLKVGVALQFTEEAGSAEGAEPDTTKAADLIIGHFSQASLADVNGARDAIKASLEAKIIEAYEGDVMGIRYTQYVTQ